MDSAFISRDPGVKLPMDLRGVGSFRNKLPFGESAWFIAGGMIENQKVSNKTYRLRYSPNAANLKEENNSIDVFNLYPNPTSSKINIIFGTSEKRKIQVLDILGNTTLKKESNTKSIQLDVSSYSKGIYLVSVETEKKNSSQKLIIQ
jgi:hypothetical protein